MHNKGAMKYSNTTVVGHSIPGMNKMGYAKETAKYAYTRLR
jgi:hypothetical protein